MVEDFLQAGRKGKTDLSADSTRLGEAPSRSGVGIPRLYDYLAARAYSAIMFGALFCTLAVKFFHAWRTGSVHEYLGWILSDIFFLLGIEVIMAIICFRWPRKWVLRVATFTAALVCTWSVMNAGWLIRTGTQIFPRVLLPLFRDPISGFKMVGVNLIKMPKAAVDSKTQIIVACDVTNETNDKQQFEPMLGKT